MLHLFQGSKAQSNPQRPWITGLLCQQGGHMKSQKNEDCALPCPHYYTFKKSSMDIILLFTEMKQLSQK